MPIEKHHRRPRFRAHDTYLAEVAELRREIEQFLDRHQMAGTAFGRRALNDAAWWARFTRPDRPVMPSPKKIDTVRAFMHLEDRRRVAQEEPRS